MSITFEHVEGVVQKAGGGTTPPAASEGTPASQKPQAETFEEMRRRQERMARRLHTD
jgi:hypothetical protein